MSRIVSVPCFVRSDHNVEPSDDQLAHLLIGTANGIAMVGVNGSAGLTILARAGHMNGVSALPVRRSGTIYIASNTTAGTKTGRSIPRDRTRSTQTARMAGKPGRLALNVYATASGKPTQPSSQETRRLCVVGVTR